MARTNIDIDPKLMRQALALTGAHSKREAVEIALTRLVQKGSVYRALGKLRGKLPWKGNVRAWRAARP